MQIFCGDSMELLRKIKVGEYKCLFADIPDNIGENYHGYKDKIDVDCYYFWVRLLIMEALPKCKLFWLMFHHSHDLEITTMLRDVLKYRHPSFSFERFLWTYTFGQYNDRDCNHGFRNLIRLKRSDCEIYPDQIREVSRRQELGDSRAQEGGRVPSNVWPIPRVVGNSEERVTWMPNQLPIRLLERIISFSLVIRVIRVIGFWTYLLGRGRR